MHHTELSKSHTQLVHHTMLSKSHTQLVHHTTLPVGTPLCPSSFFSSFFFWGGGGGGLFCVFFFFSFFFLFFFFCQYTTHTASASHTELVHRRQLGYQRSGRLVALLDLLDLFTVAPSPKRCWRGPRSCPFKHAALG